MLGNWYRSISLRSQQFSGELYISSSSWRTIVAVSSTSMSLSIRRLFGQHSKSSKRFGKTALRDIWFGTATESTENPSGQGLKESASRRFALHREVPGRI